jgi:teichuronic acid exporter
LGRNSLNKSANFNLVSNLSSYVISVLTTIILARVLAPEDYGYLVTAYIFEGIFTLFALDGYETYYMQKKSSTEKEDLYILSVTWFFRLVQSGFLFVVQIIISIIVIAYADKVLGKMLIILSLLHVTTIIGRTKEVYLSKQLDFVPIAKSNLVRDISSSLTKIVFAILGFGPLCFVIGQVIGATLKGVYILQLKSIQVRPIFDLGKGKEIFRFGVYVFASTTGAYMMQQMDRIILASYYNLKDSGLYQFSKSQSMILNNFILTPQNSLVMNFMAKFKDDKAVLDQRLTEIGVFLFTFFTPTFFLLVIYSSFYIPLFFGQKWINTVPIFNMFLIYYYFQFIMYPTNGLLTIQGKPDIKAKQSWFVFILLGIVLFILAILKISIVYYALSFSLAYIILDILVGIKGLSFLDIQYYSFFKKRLKHIKLIFIQIVVFSLIFIISPVKYYFMSIIFSLLLFWLTIVIYNKFVADEEIRDITILFLGVKYKNIINNIYLYG